MMKGQHSMVIGSRIRRAGKRKLMSMIRVMEACHDGNRILMLILSSIVFT